MENKEQDMQKHPLSEQELDEVTGGGLRRAVFVCSKCQKVFFNKLDYEAHMKQH